jgi:capsule polysaccharide export protein KpsE/RkpR
MMPTNSSQPELRHHLQRRWKIVLGIPLMASVLTYSLTYLIPPRFTATAVFLPPQQQQSMASSALQSIGMLTGLSGSLGAKNPVDQFVSFTLSNSIRNKLVDRFKLMAVYDEELREDARKELLKRTRAVGGKDGLITLEVEDTDPQRAADIANAYIKELDTLMDGLALTDSQHRRVFLDEQIKKVKVSLGEAELALKKSGVGSGAMNASPDAAVAQVAALKAQVTATEVQLQTMRDSMTENAPEIRQVRQSLGALRAQVSLLDKFDTTGDDAGYISRLREFKYQESLYELLGKQLEMAKVDEANDAPNVQVIDAATAPERKSSPKRALITGLVFISVLLMMILWLRQAATLRTSETAPS